MTVLLEYHDRAFSIFGCLLFCNLLILDPIFVWEGLFSMPTAIFNSFLLVVCVIFAEILDFFLHKIDHTILPRLR